MWGTTATLPAGATKVADVVSSSDGQILCVIEYTNNLIFRSANGGTSRSIYTTTELSLGIIGASANRR